MIGTYLRDMKRVTYESVRERDSERNKFEIATYVRIYICMLLLIPKFIYFKKFIMNVIVGNFSSGYENERNYTVIMI